MKRITLFVLLLLTPALSADIIKVDISGECISHNLSGQNAEKYDFQVGDTINVSIEYDTANLESYYTNFTTDPVDQYKAYGYKSDNAILKYEISWSRNGSLINELDRTEFIHKNVLIKKESFYHQNSLNPFSSDWFSIGMDNIPGNTSTRPAWEDYFELQFGYDQYIYNDETIYPDMILGQDYYPFKTMVYSGMYLETNDLISGTVFCEFSVDDITVIPEPVSLTFLAIGGSMLLKNRRKPFLRNK